MALLMAMHRIAYTATASVAYLPDYMRKLQKAMSIKDGLRYIHLHAPCHVGFGYDPSQAEKVARMAVLTNVFPLWEVEKGRLRFTNRVLFPHRVAEYLSLSKKYEHLTQEETWRIQRSVDSHIVRLKRLAHFG